MDKLTLISSRGLYRIDESITPVEAPPDDHDVVIDPSLTYRKNFEIPTGVNKPQRKIQLKIFSRFLPEEIDQFTCQFLTGTVEYSSKTKVCGLGIRNDKLTTIKNKLTGNQEIYFLEALLTNPFSDRRTQLTVTLPEGRLLTQFESEFLIWSNFRNKTKEQHVYKPNFLREPQKTFEFPEFPDLTEHESTDDWLKQFFRCLVPEPSKDLSIASHSYGPLWERWESTCQITLTLLVVTLLGWVGVKGYANAVRQDWLRQEYRKLTNQQSSRPYRTLKKKVSTLEKKVNQAENNELRAPLYSVIPKIDTILGDRNISLLTFELSRDSLEMTFLSTSLEDAEQFRNDLQSIHVTTDASIINSSRINDGNYEYEITLTSGLDLE